MSKESQTQDEFRRGAVYWACLTIKKAQASLEWDEKEKCWFIEHPTLGWRTADTWTELCEVAREFSA